jgi:hypothetical protein
MRHEPQHPNGIDAHDGRRAGFAARSRDAAQFLHRQAICEQGRQRLREDTIVKQTLNNSPSDESGATVIEYGLIAAGIALASSRL